MSLRTSLYLSITCFLLLSLECFSQSKQQMQLLAKGKSVYRIVIPAKATPVEIYAASEFQNYFFRISKVKLEIVRDNISPVNTEILIGGTSRSQSINYKNLPEDGFLIRTANQKLFIAGGKRKGTLYGVYTFLEKYLGCRMYTKAVVKIPQLDEIKLDASFQDRQIPAFAFRTVHYKEAVDTVYCNWHKINYVFEGWGSYAHTFEKLLPPSQYFAEHPEYFALFQGKRLPQQLCPSNPNVIPIIVRNLKAEINKKPQLKYWSISQNDNHTYCHCQLCEKINQQEGSPQAAILKMVNKVAEKFPDKIISTLAYQYSQKPPKTIKPAKNVSIMLCNIDVTRGLSIKDDPRAKSFRDDIAGWRKLTQKIFIWDYVVQFTNSMAPFPNMHTLQPNLQFFYSNQVQQLFEQGIGIADGEFSELKTYLIAKMMWDPQINFIACRDEFIDNYYGSKATAYVKQYIDEMQKAVISSNIPLRAHGNPADASSGYLSEKNMVLYNRLIKEALDASEGTAYYDRVSRINMSLKYATIIISAKNIEQAKKNPNAKQTATTNKTKQEVESDLAAFMKESRRLRISSLTEGGKRLDQFEKEIKDKL